MTSPSSEPTRCLCDSCQRMSDFDSCQFILIRTPSKLTGYNRGQKSWDTFAFLGSFPFHAGPTPPLTPQTMLDACI